MTPHDQPPWGPIMSAQPGNDSVLNVPNLLSLARIPLAVVLFVCIVYQFWLVGLVAFVVACATDWLDGWWARRYGPLTLIGRNLDPLADKILVCGAFIYLLPVPNAGLTPWMVTVVVVRELLVTGIRGMVEATGKKFGADWFGKLKMGLQCACIIAVLLVLSLHAAGIAGPTVDWLLVGQLVLLWVMLAATAGSGVQYIVKAVRLMRPGEPRAEPAHAAHRWRKWIALLAVTAVAVIVALVLSRGPRELDRYPPAGASRYRLPWPGGVGHLCVQGNHGIVSHHEGEEFAYDFAMPVGSPVSAARAGEVSGVEQDREGYGPGQLGNAVTIDHEDGTAAVYAHIRRGGSRVRVGDRVARGQVIAESGNIGNSMMPHLHFHVYDHTGRSVPVTFPEADADAGVPRIFRSYTSANASPE